MVSTSTHFRLGTLPVTGTGLGFAEEHLLAQLVGPVAGLVFDDTGTVRIRKLLDGVADTDFSKESFDELLASDNAPENWRVGEALAEHHLQETKGCHFPWPDGRDERKRGSSLPGADLVGIQSESGVERFAFGEVKTSSENKYPPGVMHGRHGLKQQLEDLRDCRNIRHDLVLYLGHRADGSPWEEQYKKAAGRYLNDSCDVRVFGLLVRDVLPHEDDLRARVEKLADGCPPTMVIELIAIYLPLGSIATLSTTVVASRQKGGAS